MATYQFEVVDVVVAAQQVPEAEAHVEVLQFVDGSLGGLIGKKGHLVQVNGDVGKIGPERQTAVAHAQRAVEILVGFPNSHLG